MATKKKTLSFQTGKPKTKKKGKTKGKGSSG